jgi:hypothetical protein
MTKLIAQDVLPKVDMNAIEMALDDIQASWKRTTEAILETAEVLYKYRMSSDWSTISKELDKRNVIKDSIQKYLLGIAQNPTLMDSAVWGSLPPHYNTLYHMSRIGSEKLRTLLDKGTINQATQLDEARELADKFSTKKKNAKRHVTEVVAMNKSATIRMDFPKGQGTKKQLKEIVDLLSNNYPDVTITLK